MRILISNDDGIHAPGLKALARIARALSDDVWVVAPETEKSGAGHSLTLHRPVRVRRVSGRRFSVTGTPTDCVMLGINKLVPPPRPDLVLSGVNRGSNVADDVTYSGTVAAAMEATMLGVPAIALSQSYDNGRRVHWSTAERHGPGLIRRLVAIGWPSGVLINVNFPDRTAAKVGGVVICRQGRHKFGDAVIERVDPRGRPYFWVGSVLGRQEAVPGTDITVIDQGGIAVTALSLDMTDRPTTEALRAAFA